MPTGPGERDKAAREADLDWLYRGERPQADEIEEHPVNSPDQLIDLAELRRQTPAASEQQRATPEELRQESLARASKRPSPAPKQPAVVQSAPSHTPDNPDWNGSGPARKRRRFRPRRLVRTIFWLVIAYLVFLLAMPALTLGQMNAVDATPSGKRPSRQPGKAVLLVGTDSREGLSDKERERLGTGDAEGHRADTILLLYKPIRGKSALISLPRDSWVEIPGQGMGKLNASYAYGGAELLAATVEQSTGIRVDGYLEIGFGGFANMVDAVGGVNVCLDEPMQDELAHIDLPAGCQTLDGAQALGYVRMRYSDPRGDLGRAERQREVIAKVAKKVASPATLLNPIRYASANRALGKTIVKGDDTGFGTLLASGFGVLNVSKGDGLSLVVPLSDPYGWSPDGQSVVIWDEAQAAQMFDEISRGDTSKLARFRPQ